MASLGLNIDHVATIRQARGGNDPDPITAACIAELSGAEAITVHLREDRRHIQDRDVRILKQILKSRLNLEMAATEEIQKIALEIIPYSCTLVPEKRQEITTEGGLDVASNIEYMTKFTKTLNDKGIIVSMFIDPDSTQIEASAKAGAQFIELHTGQYAEKFNTPDEEKELNKLIEAAQLAEKMGLKVNAGHGLNYFNVKPVAAIDNMNELNIGHSIISKAVFVGLDRAVRDMINLIK